jgi:hypothetical protein
MSCTRGCCDSQREHYQSIGTLTQGRSDWHKTKTHRTDTATVDVTEHFDGRQDVTVKPDPIAVKAKVHTIGQEG